MAPSQRQRQLFYLKKDQKKPNGKKSSKTEESSDIGLVYPGGDTAFKLLLSARFCSAIWSHVTDCDETFNYWEPSHYLLYGTGQQTWEYSPEFALRSYTYLLLHVVPAKIYCYLLEPNPVLVFYFIRCLLSIGSAVAEIYFYKNVCREFGVHIARLTLAFLILSSGMYISSSAFLPSSFSMYLSTAATAAWYDRKYELAIFATAISALLGWPFAALLGVPIALDVLIRRGEWMRFLRWSILSGLVILGPMVWFDSVYFGKLVVAPLNIVTYNVFTSHGANLYGTEPFIFYVINGFLNFNFIFVGALAAPLILLLTWAVVPARPRSGYCLPYWYSLAPLYLWFVVFFCQAHKEERFLFPVYPMICLAGAISVDAIQKLYFFVRTQIYPLAGTSHYLQHTTPIMIIAMIVCGALGLSRTFALYNAGYDAPMEMMMEANKMGSDGRVPKDVGINFCIGKEWHRFPSSFYFPSNNWKLQYVRSEFRGQLPQAFSDQENGTSVVQPNFNDLNREETSRYFDVDRCHFLLDLDLGRETDLEPNYSARTDQFTVIKSAKFLDASASHPFFRAFYVPFLSGKYSKYGKYNLLQSTKFKLTPTSGKSKGSRIA